MAGGIAGGIATATGGGGTGVAWCCELPSVVFWVGGAGGELLACWGGSTEVAC